MKSYEIDSKMIAPLKVELLATYEDLTTTDKEVVRSRKQELSLIVNKIEKVEERFALEIDRSIYEKISEKLRDEKKKIDNEIDGPNQIIEP